MNLEKITGSDLANESSGTGSIDTRVTGWLTELEDALKREKDWRKEAKATVRLYEGKKKQENQFNILFSNTETLSPALYNSTPRPLVERRFKDADPIGKMVSRIGQRSLEFLIDPANCDYVPFDDLMEQAVLEALVPGRGVTRFKYEAIFNKVEPGETLESEEEGEALEPADPIEQVSYETICGESIPWDRFRHGYAKSWQDVPWVSFEHFMTREECVANFKEIGAKLPLTIDGSSTSSDSDDSNTEKVEDAEGVKLAHIFEIWDKETKKVLFICPGYKAGMVKEVEDPLSLNGFFPMPKPLTLFASISSLIPITLYSTYEEQAKELNRITVRINRIVSALKVRGFYDGTLQGFERLLESADNTLLPAENVAAMQQGQTLEKSIWFMPIERLINVLQQLYVQREQIKQVIYEITGISDILRGSSVASETATAQNIKNQWGTLRLKKQQKRVSRYVRDCLRIMGELAMTKLSSETLTKMTALKFPSAEEKQLAQQTQAQQQALTQPGQPPAPPDPALQAVLTLPSWEELRAIMSDDILRNYKIDIETNSTVDAEATEDKANMGEFLNALAQFLNGVAPMVEQGILPFDAAKSIMLAVTRRYRFGPEVEDELSKMAAPQPQGEKPDPAAEANAAKAKAEVEAMQQEQQMSQQRNAMELQNAQEEAALARQTAQLDSQLHAAEVQAKMAELQRTGELAIAKHNTQLQVMALQLETAKAKAAAAKAAPKSPAINNS